MLPSGEIFKPAGVEPESAGEAQNLSIVRGLPGNDGKLAVGDCWTPFCSPERESGEGGIVAEFFFWLSDEMVSVFPGAPTTVTSAHTFPYIYASHDPK